MRFSQSKALVMRFAAPGVNAFLVLEVFVVTLSLEPGKHVLPSPLHTPHLSTTALEPMMLSHPTFCTDQKESVCMFPECVEVLSGTAEICE